jgi:hypothetical protein
MYVTITMDELKVAQVILKTKKEQISVLASTS